VHGTASVLDMASRENVELRATVLNIYVPQYGAEWEEFFDANAYVRIVASRMFTFHMTQ
jgi:hypothetical protein